MVEERQVSLRLRVLIEGLLGITVSNEAESALLDFLEIRRRERKLPSVAAMLEIAEREPGERQALINVATIGETHFFRDLEALDALSDWMVDRFAEVRRPLQVWCTGCSSGEEAYSLAILANERMCPIKILATDVDTDGLAAARQGRYDDWSLRKVSPALRAKYLVDGRVNESLRAKVEAREHNLLDPTPKPWGGFDIVLCRNVLIYFNGARALETVERLLEALAPGGLLVLGGAEAASLQPPRATRLSRGALQALIFDPQPKNSTGNDSTADPALDESGFYRTQLQHLGLTRVLTDWQEVVSALGAGNAQRALEILIKLRQEDPMNAEIHYLEALAHRRLNTSDQVDPALKRALFADPSFWPASFMLAKRCDAQGSRKRALPYFRQTLISLDNRNPKLSTWSEAIRALIPFEKEVRSTCEQRISALEHSWRDSETFPRSE
jgi:chemotaxis protein methyltransferase CheR